MNYPWQVGKIFEIFEKNGFESYIVGGCLRNMLMGKEPNDWDMTTSALPKETLEIFSSLGYHVIETGMKHGTVTVMIDGLPIEITTFRIDGEYSDSRHPDKVTFTRSLTEDLARRDFTVNAMAYSDKTGLVDLYGGKEDLNAGLLRCVGDPELRFSEDALRILRAFRFASEHGFSIEGETRKAIIKQRDGLRAISRERICSELLRTLMGEFAESAVSEIVALSLMPCIFEGYCDDFAPPSGVIGTLPLRFPTRLAALICNFEDESCDRAISSLKMSNADKTAVKGLLSAVRFLEGKGFDGIITARRFIQRYGDCVSDAVLLAQLLGADVEEAKKHLEEAEKTVFPHKISELDIGGSDIMELGVSGKGTGEVLSFLFERATEDPALNERSTLIILAKKYILENLK
ncbi:MAG: CCA tRNA nucleotidyltransferase [Ruminococcaceae bacterium]|nr:CCA tRNA nucleotidyltransferase [Oscillospiraceae bacterium]